MKELYNKYKREIWVGVVVSLITTAILKFGDWVIAVVPKVGVTLFDTISNVLYSLAATHTDNLLTSLLLFGSFGVLAGTFANPAIEGTKLYIKTLRLEKKAKKYSTEEIKQLDEEIAAEQNNHEKEAKSEGILETIQEGKRVGKSAIHLVIVAILTYLFLTFFVTKPMNLYNKFEQDMIKIAPYIEAEQVTQLRSDWVCMRSQADYDEIYDVINQVIEDNNLPK
jgi:hypothetical protein